MVLTFNRRPNREAGGEGGAGGTEVKKVLEETVLRAALRKTGIPLILYSVQKDTTST